MFDLPCFCCKHDDLDLSESGRIFATLAFAIARQCQAYRAALVALLSDREGTRINTAGLKDQSTMPFSEPLPRATMPDRTHVIIVDALY